VKTNEQLVAAAYDEAKERILQDLQSRIHERDRWIRDADEDTKAFWLRVRERGIPDRAAERDAYQRLAEQIRATA
jgi:hypothetical protein